MEKYVNFNQDILSYDLHKFNFQKWTYEVIHELYPNIMTLENIHNELSVLEIAALQKYVQNACGRNSFKNLINSFLKEYILPLVDKPILIQRYPTLRAVIPNQASHGRKLSYHQGIFVGNGVGLRTIWLPVTNAYESNTMWMVNYKNSKELTDKVLKNNCDSHTFEKECIKKSIPANLVPGEVLLFNQELIHGNINNETDITRFSFDMRILLQGENFGRKYPGQYFRTIEDDFKNAPYVDGTYITYAGWNSEYTRHLPLLLQRYAIDDYCIKNDITYTEYSFENEYLDHTPYLIDLITSYNIDAIVLSSIFAMSDIHEVRKNIYNLAAKNNVQLHFAQEDLVLTDTDNIDIIESYLTFGESYRKFNLFKEIYNE